MKNKYEIRGDVTAIFINSNEGIGEVVIDTEDLQIVDSFNGTWCFSNERKAYVSMVEYYPREKGKPRKYERVLMHRFLMNPLKAQVIDHINGNGLDNRKANLRIVTQAENMQNRITPPAHNKSGIIGVSWNKRNKCWVVQVNINKKRVNIGSYTTKEEAEFVSNQARAKFLNYSKEAREVVADDDSNLFDKSGKPYRVNKSSGVRNVTWRKDIKKWQVHFQKNKKKLHFGHFDNLEDAKRAAEVAREMLSQ